MGTLLDGQRGLRSAMRKLTVLANTGGTCHFYLAELRVSQSLIRQVLPFFYPWWNSWRSHHRILVFRQQITLKKKKKT